VAAIDRRDDGVPVRLAGGTPAIQGARYSRRLEPLLATVNPPGAESPV